MDYWLNTWALLWMHALSLWLVPTTAQWWVRDIQRKGVACKGSDWLPLEISKIINCDYQYIIGAPSYCDVFNVGVMFLVYCFIHCDSTLHGPFLMLFQSLHASVDWIWLDIVGGT